MNLRGIVIAEGLKDPSLVNQLRVFRARITDEGAPIDYEGHIGRWHLYWVSVNEGEVQAIREMLKPGWYAHFWEGDRLVVVYDDAAFEMSRTDRDSWVEAIQHGEGQGIPKDELDFPTD